MSSDLKPIKVWGHDCAPNPGKIMLILKTLDLPLTNECIEFADVKKEPFISVNPNGRLPAIEDPNTGMTLWETGAIILYLVETYDEKENISYQSRKEKWDRIKWLMFQVSGQGPYIGQLAWFARFHQPAVPSATERYANEMNRIASVLDGALKDRDWLVGDKCTYADLSFVTWVYATEALARQLQRPGEMALEEKYANYGGWYRRMWDMLEMREVLETIRKGRETRGLPFYHLDRREW